MRIDPAGWPFVLGGVVLAIVLAFTISKVLGFAVLGLSAFFLFFFRDPERQVNVPDSGVVSPADGRVMVAGPATTEGFPADTWQQISIFLSPMDVHVNRMPVAGRVVKVTYRPGRFLPAYKAESGDLNEFTEVVVDHDGTSVVVRQIVGVLARRIVCRIKAGDVVRAGDRFGVMKFGSRMDVFIPHDSTVHVTVGATVRGGVTLLATLPPRPPAAITSGRTAGVSA
jgi:phosphatidylserine decarboxylase